MPVLVVIAFGWALTVGVCWCLGKLLLQALSIRLFRQEEHVFAFVVGSACFSAVMFFLCAAGIVHRGVLLTLAAAVIGLTVWKGAYRERGESLPPLPMFWRIFFYSIYAIFAGMYLFAAFAPEGSPDGAGYHLGLAKLYLRNHGFTRITTDFHASFPQGMEVLFLFALTWGRYSAAALLECTYLLLLPFAILNFTRRLGVPVAGVVGGLLIFTCPIAGLTGTTAYNDAALTCVVFTVFALLQIWDEERDIHLLVPAGLAAGFAFDIKYTAFPAAIYAAGYVAWRLLRKRNSLWRPLALVSACAAVMILPTLVKNWIVVDNPVSPFLNRAFRNPYVHPSFEDQLGEQMRDYNTVKHYRQIPLEVTVLGENLQGLLGPVFLLAPLLLFSLGSSGGRRLAIPALLFALPYPANIGTRFLLPCAVFVAPMMGLALSRWPAACAVLTLAGAITAWPTVVPRYCARNAFRLQLPRLRAVIRKQPEAEYLAQHLAGYQIATMINELVPLTGKVFSLSDVPGAYCAREVLVGFYSASTERLRDTLWQGAFTDWQPNWAQVFRCKPVSLRKLRLVQRGTGYLDDPSISEVKVFGENGQIAPQASWRTNAFPFPWDAGLAADQQPITRWRAWEPRFDGMYLELDLGELQTIQAVQMDHAHDQWYTKFELQGEINGRWTVLSNAPENITLEPRTDYRQLALEQLKKNGIGYLLIRNGDYGEKEFRDKYPLWGLRRLSEREGAVLFQIE